MPTYAELLEENAELRRQVAEQERRIAEQEGRIAEQERQNATLKRRIADLEKLIEEVRRRGKRQAAPFSKGAPSADPKPPGYLFTSGGAPSGRFSVGTRLRWTAGRLARASH